MQPFAKNLIHARKRGRRDRGEKGCCYSLTKDTRSTISRFCLDWNYIVLSIQLLEKIVWKQLMLAFAFPEHL